ncbi:MAG: UDP-N-acetylmuramoyl-L-alanine--D-glutamate ligase [Parachlamydiaceae bacterium]
MGKTLIIGMGVSGQAAAKLLLKRGHSVVGADSRYLELAHETELAQLLRQGLILVNDKVPIFFGDIDLVIVSPGISLKHPLYIAAKGENKRILSEIELGCLYLLDQKVVGITGTNGKTTVTFLIEHILNYAGRKAVALGNVGVALSAEIEGLDQNQTIVLELSSYQLEMLNQKVLDIGVILNITPDHLDRYGTMEAYARAKLNMQKCIKPEGLFLVEEKAAKQYSPLISSTSSYQQFGYQPSNLYHTDLKAMFYAGRKMADLPEAYKGQPSVHLENFLAASAACHALGISYETIVKSLPSFTVPKHRLEFVRKIKGVSYYDDSKGTNVEAVKRAVEMLPNDVILIAGGVDKGESYTYWTEGFKGKVKCICAIGEAKEKIKENLEAHISVLTFNDLKEAVHYASSIAKPNDSILLSPGCASYDMFRDYVHRGREFQSIVNSLG